jgi:glycosyltransferase involved in cell wall biosynthesis
MRSTGVDRAAIRVLVVHNSYQQRGGEDNVVDAEVALLRASGHTVETYRRHNDELNDLGRAAAAAQSLWSRRTVAEVGEVLGRVRPHVIHVHNIVPLISPSLYWVAARARVPVVQTLHNFRLLCLQSMLLRDGQPCEDCVGKVPWRGVLRRCYRTSAVQSAVLAATAVTHRALGTYDRKIARYIALTEFARKKFVQGGVPADRLVVKPNFADIPDPDGRSRAGGLFVGRLSREKGLDVLLGALARRPGLTVRVVGSGPEGHKLEGQPDLVASGWLTGPQTMERMQTASYLVLPSICYENFPLAIVEAFACRLPVIASRLGSMAELVADGHTGLLFDPGSSEDLAA